MEQSPNLENVDIRAWAQQIREMKIHELEDYIKQVSNKNRITDVKKKLKTLKNAN
jgi:hypothetical protein